MSVINKMLRDLDARRGDARVPDLPQAVIPATMEGTASVAPLARQRALRWGLTAALLFLLLLVSAWYLHTTQPVTPPPVLIVAPAPAVQPVEVSTPPITPDSETLTSAAPASPGDATSTTREPPPQAEVPVMEAPRKKRRRSETVAAEASPPAAAQPRPRVSSDTAAPIPVPAAQPAAAPAETPVPAIAQRRQTAAQETLVQAQALWNSGSREAALELVREAVVAVERMQPSDTALLAQLVREQVRMELALGRPAAVLALLARLESPLSGQADLWAVRGNAAQRLGRHQESVQAYLAALQLRPSEPRWMLGAAVSLAALGQLEAAARQAEQARALGPISPEVLAYLRQAGVPLR